MIQSNDYISKVEMEMERLVLDELGRKEFKYRKASEFYGVMRLDMGGIVLLLRTS